MKKYLLFLLCLFSVSLYAQKSERRLERFPDWVFEKPIPENGTYIFVVEHGDADTEIEARNQAMGLVYRNTIQRLGLSIDMNDINNAIRNGDEYGSQFEKLNVPVHKVCEYVSRKTESNNRDYKYRVYVLCQVAKAGNIYPNFVAYTDCYKSERYKEIKNTIETRKRDERRKLDTKSVFASIFLPGTGQILKGHKAEGALTMIGDLGLLGGGIATYFVAKDKIEHLKNDVLDYQAYNKLTGEYNALRISSYAMFAAAGALYIFNVYRAYALEPKDSRIAFYPTLLPTNDNQIVLGVGMSINF